MNCLVTGGAGFIGSHIVEWLLSNDYKVDVVDNLSTGNLKNLPSHNARLQFYPLDISNTEDENWELLDNHYDVIVHCASYNSFKRSDDFPILDSKIRVGATINLIKKFPKCRFILLSSLGGLEIQNEEHGTITESSVVQAKNIYALNNIFAEYALSTLHKDYFILRLSNVYGQRQSSDEKYGSLMGILLDRYKRDRDIVIRGDGKQVRDFISVDDVAQAVIKVCQLTITNYRLFNICSGTSIDIKGILDIFNSVGIAALVKYIPPDEGVRTVFASSELANKYLSWNTQDSLSTYIPEEVKSWRGNERY